MSSALVRPCLGLFPFVPTILSFRFHTTLIVVFSCLFARLISPLAVPMREVRMGTARVKQEEEDSKIIVIEYEIWKKGTWARRGKIPNKAKLVLRSYLQSSLRDTSPCTIN